MKRFTQFVALSVAALLVAAPVWAQGTTSSPGDKTTTGTTGTGGATDKAAGATTEKGASGDKATSGDAMKKDRTAGSSDMGGKGAGKGKRQAQGGDPEQVKAVQQALKDKGRDPGEVDGRMGPKTKTALRDFQKKEGLKATGSMDGETMSKLGVTASTGAAGGSSPSASPGMGTSGSSGASGGASGTTGSAGASGATGPSGASGGTSPSASPGAGQSGTTGTEKK